MKTIRKTKLISLSLFALVASSTFAGGHRSSSARRSFMRATGYPEGRPDYVLDHVVPLKWWCRLIIQHAVANESSSEGKRQVGVTTSIAPALRAPAQWRHDS